MIKFSNLVTCTVNLCHIINKVCRRWKFRFCKTFLGIILLLLKHRLLSLTREFPSLKKPRNIGCWSLNCCKSNMKRKLRCVGLLLRELSPMFILSWLLEEFRIFQNVVNLVLICMIPFKRFGQFLRLNLIIFFILCLQLATVLNTLRPLIKLLLLLLLLRLVTV